MKWVSMKEESPICNNDEGWRMESPVVLCHSIHGSYWTAIYCCEVIDEDENESYSYWQRTSSDGYTYKPEHVTHWTYIIRPRRG